MCLQQRALGDRGKRSDWHASYVDNWHQDSSNALDVLRSTVFRFKVLFVIVLFLNVKGHGASHVLLSRER